MPAAVPPPIPTHPRQAQREPRRSPSHARHAQRVGLFFLALLLAALPACNLQSPADPEPEEVSPPESSGAPATPDPSIPALAPCDEAQPPLVTSLEIVPAPDQQKPEAREPFRDPLFGACLVRVSDHEADLPEGDSAGGLKNEYARVQSFNADGTRLLLRGTSGAWYLYDAATFTPLGRLELGIDPRWDASDPNRLYSFDGTRLTSHDIRTGEAALVHDFAADFPGQSLAAVWMRYEGSPSADGRTWGLMAEDENWETVAFLVYDLDQDRISARRDLSGVPGAAGIDSVTISPSGDYFLADFGDSYCERGAMGTDQAPCGVMVYDRGLETGRGLLRIGGHMDLALDVTDREVAVFQDLDADSISMADLASGTVTPLWPIDFSHSPLGFHISGRAFERPGWAVVSTYNGAQPAATWMDDQVFVIELKPNGRVVRLAHTRSRFAEGPVGYGEKDYWAEPHASANRDLTRILFTSNWGEAGTELVDMYQISLPAEWTEALP
jgi:hypothetical protein